MPKEDSTARFYHHPSRGADGVYKDIIYVEIRVKGDRNTSFSRPKTEDDEVDYPRQWKSFKSNQPEELDGTPVGALPRVSESDRLNLAEMGVYTVEDLAALPDSSIQNIKLGTAVRARARAYLAALESEEGEESPPEVNEPEHLDIEETPRRKPGRPRKNIEV